MASPLAPLLALAGQCFVGDVAPGTRDEHCFDSVYEGQHVRDVHRVIRAGRTVYQGETIYSIEGDAIIFTYWSSIGGIGRGTAKLGMGDWQFVMTMRARPTALPQPFTTRWTWSGNDRYSVAGGPAPVTYRRTAPK